MADKTASQRDTVLVVGLGRFGGAVAESLIHLGHEVLAIDEDAEIVQRWSERLTHVVQADSTRSEALRQLGAKDISRAVVAIGSDVEASVLTVLALEEVGITDIWAKAVSSKHGQILERVGAQHVVYPEAAMGERVAHLVTGRMIDFIEFDDGFAIAKTNSPSESWEKTLSESNLRQKYGITVVGLKRRHADFTYAQADTYVESGDILIVSGPTRLVEKFSSLA
ncbi:potassium channel family protein [Lysobacter sp. A3-1-A15]|uniref:potassium channel family protein n=1 Tax=Novilysobacter viscosus TaxID=3098602 RepID=UPI002EDBB3B2